MRAKRMMIAGLLLVAVLPVACGEGDESTPGEAGVAEQDATGIEPDADADAEPDAPPEGPTEAPEDSQDEPDADLLADPCAAHEGREGEAFIDLVAPVDEQVASGDIEIVGCSNVFEATVAWTLLDGDGRTLDEGFTTAECGTGCVGEFRDTISLEAAAEEPVAYLQVYSENMADEGPDQLELNEVVVVIE